MQLFECLQNIHDPRKKRGIRHPFQPVLQFVLLGFTCRLVAIEHMVSFFKPIWNQLKAPLGFNRSEPPDPTTIRRMLNGRPAGCIIPNQVLRSTSEASSGRKIYFSDQCLNNLFSFHCEC